jgi:hypothetical protein
MSTSAGCGWQPFATTVHELSVRPSLQLRALGGTCEARLRSSAPQERLPWALRQAANTVD